jgi:hypothetical protein
MTKITHAFAVALIFEVAGENRVAEYCLENGITLCPVRFVHYDAMGELVSLGEEIYSILPVKDPPEAQLRML